MYQPELISLPAELPITLADAKLHLRVEGGDEDVLINSLIAAAVNHLDGWSGILKRCLITQTWAVFADKFSQKIRLPLVPIGSIVSVKYKNSSDVETIIDALSYDFFEDSLGAVLRFKNSFALPTDLAEIRALRIEFTAGYDLADAVPASIKAALLLMIGHAYENREGVVVGTISSELPLGVYSLLSPYRRRVI